MIKNHQMLNVSVVIRKVIMLDISQSKTKFHDTTQEPTITSLMIEEEEMTKGVIRMEEMKE